MICLYRCTISLNIVIINLRAYILLACTNRSRYIICLCRCIILLYWCIISPALCSLLSVLALCSSTSCYLSLIHTGSLLPAPCSLLPVHRCYIIPPGYKLIHTSTCIHLPGYISLLPAPCMICLYRCTISLNIVIINLRAYILLACTNRSRYIICLCRCIILLYWCIISPAHAYI